MRVGDSDYSKDPKYSEDMEYSEDPEYSKDPEYYEGSEYSEELEEFDKSKGLASPKSGKVNQIFKTAISAWNFSEEEKDDWLRQLSQTRKCRHDLVLALLTSYLAQGGKTGSRFENWAWYKLP
ncbi:hypothetical protein MMC22_008918 [Lobaria immixta]|nr:hypothetical protein [Lobaria immixta]